MTKQRKLIIIFNFFVAIFIGACILPILYLAPYGRATGDDLSNSIVTHQVWVETQSVIKVLDAAVANIKSMYSGWEGCYTSDFLYAMQPELFGVGGYVVTPYINILLWFFSIWYFLHRLFNKIYGFSYKTTLSISLIFWFLTMEYIPSTQNSIFWWAGSMHYTFAMSVCFLMLGLSIAYIYSDRSSGYSYYELLGLCFLAFLLGGVNYQTALLGLLGLLYFGVYAVISGKGKRTINLCIPILIYIVGLFLSVSAPGNKVRGGELMEFSARDITYTVIESFIEGFKDINTFVIKKPILMIGMIGLFGVIYWVFCLYRRQTGIGECKLKHKGVLVAYLLCVYAAMHAPLIFSGAKDATSGPSNINYIVLYMVILIVEILVADWLSIKTAKWECTDRQSVCVCMALMLVFCIVLFQNKWYVKESTTYRCIDYIVSGRADDFREQMEKQTEVLLRKDGRDLVIVAASDDQGPLQHMPVTPDPNKFTNEITARYYGVDTVRVEE